MRQPGHSSGAASLLIDWISRLRSQSSSQALIDIDDNGLARRRPEVAPLFESSRE
jgi:hypothetical protein